MSEQATPFELLGGEKVLFALVERFYALMDSEPEFHAVRKLHPEDLAGSRDKLFMFLCGYLGGPPLYQEKIGNPMLRDWLMRQFLATADWMRNKPGDMPGQL